MDSGLDRDMFLELLNEVLKEQPQYVEGMAFIKITSGVEPVQDIGYGTTTLWPGDGGAYLNAFRLAHARYND